MKSNNKSMTRSSSSKHRAESSGKSGLDAPQIGKQQIAHDKLQQSQEKRFGDRQSVPNIEEISVKSSTDENQKIIPKDSSVEKEIQDSEKTIKREPSTAESQKEVRMLLEYLFLDVKVRSPDEVRRLRDYRTAPLNFETTDSINLLPNLFLRSNN
jgi:hypothetical protein